MKTILLLTHHLKNFAGSEINIYELAITFTKYGYIVEVGTFLFEPPIANIFKRQNINVKNLFKDKLKLKKYSLIWCQHSPVLNFVLFEQAILANNIIFSSLSPYEPLEVPPVFLRRYISLFVANSKETKKQMIEESIDKDNIVVLPNSVTDDYFEMKSKRPYEKIRRVAIVSNHIPVEIYELKKHFEKNGVECLIYGLGHKEEFITSAILSQFDMIISIGKTVQFALALGIPVYVYDRFGGDGWVVLDNIDLLEEYNFSGRYKKEKNDSQTIFKEITNGYSRVIKEVNGLKEIAKDRYSLSKNIKKLISDVDKKSPRIIDISKYEFMKRTSKYYTRLLQEFQEQKHFINAMIENQEQQLKEIKTKNQTIQTLEKTINLQEKEIQKLIVLADSMRIKNRIKRLFTFYKKETSA